MNPLSAAAALDLYFLDARARLLDLAAVLDRIDRGGGAAGDARLNRIREALGVLLTQPGGRAGRVQELFSDDYDPDWPRPQPK